MAQSVKLKDGSYIDAEGIYDAKQAMTQQAVNTALMNQKFLSKFRTAAARTEYTFNTEVNEFWIFTAYGILATCGSARNLKVLCSTGARTFTLTHDGNTNTLTASDTLYGGILVIS